MVLDMEDLKFGFYYLLIILKVLLKVIKLIMDIMIQKLKIGIKS